LFSGEVRIPGQTASNPMILLGKKLFSEKKLSGKNSRSCASCHQPQKYYSDQLTKNLALDQRSGLKRNTPTLLYAGFQSAQFWDGRAKTAGEQILDVLTSPQEMNGRIPIIERKLNQNIKYRIVFRKAFHSKDSITIDQVSIALASFIHSLAPMNSAFDRYFHGDKKALSPDQIKGFNLFMGKAQCGTCHFIPFFNGLTPPFFNRSEYEVLGVTENDNFKMPILDKDEGRFSYFPSPYYLSAFKTPTLRNIAMTGPYMHNGSFKSLTKVMEFYNLGGGAGMGLRIPNQTLSDKPLHLTNHEIREITLFLKSLTDRPEIPN
jgi:cytochrome c peroxidase